MRTTFVNPTRRKRRRPAAKRKRRNPTGGAKRTGSSLAAYRKGMKDAMATYSNPRRRKRRRPTATKRRRRAAPVRRRRRRRNAGITPFVSSSNPLILRNARRRRRSNPKLSLRSALNGLMYHGGGSALGAAANILALNKIENMWMRNGARIGAAVLSSVLLGPKWKGMGAATAGALLYPVWQEVALRVLAPAAAATEADMDLLSADLTEALSGVNMEDLVDNYN